MKKRLIGLIIISFILFAFTGEKGKKNDPTDLNLKGKVKSLTEINYKAVVMTGEIQTGDIIDKTIYSFNDKGNKIEENIYRADGSLDASGSGKYNYKYDDKGNMIEENYYRSYYDKSSNGWISSPNYEKNIYKYDNKGNMIEENLYDEPKGSLFAKYICKYDDKGNNIEDDYYMYINGDSLKSIFHIFKYDDKENIIEHNEYQADGSLYYKFIYNYDNIGNKIEEKCYIYTISPSLDYNYYYKYVYDKTGNWIKKTTFENDIPEKITEREIKYNE